MMTTFDTFMQDNGFSKEGHMKYADDRGVVSYDGTAFHSSAGVYGAETVGEAITSLDIVVGDDNHLLANEGYKETEAGVWKSGTSRITRGKDGRLHSPLVGAHINAAEMIIALRTHAVNKEYAITDCLVALARKVGLPMDEMYGSWGTAYMDVFKDDVEFTRFLKNKVAGRGVYADVVKFIGRPVLYGRK